MTPPKPRKKAPCPLTLASRARFIDAAERDDVPALQGEAARLEAKVAAWRAFTGRREDLASGVRDAIDRFNRDPEAGERLLREALNAISRRVLRLRQAEDRRNRPRRGDAALRHRDPAVREAARRRIWGRG